MPVSWLAAHPDSDDTSVPTMIRLGDVVDASFTHPPYLSASAFDYGGSVGAQEIVMLDVNFTHCASTPKDFGVKNGNEKDTSSSGAETVQVGS
jgi:hypothetical protein